MLNLCEGIYKDWARDITVVEMTDETGTYYSIAIGQGKNRKDIFANSIEEVETIMKNM